MTLAAWKDPATGTCFACGKAGHVKADCPDGHVPDHDPRPAWCGDCGRISRMISYGTFMQRCPVCHPLRYKPLAQHVRCACGKLRYPWDHTPCDDGRHARLAS